MREHDKLPDLIGDIYDASLEPALWTSVLASIMDFVGSRSCALVLKDPVSKLGDIKYHVGVAPHFVQVYADEYAALDPLATIPRVGQVMNIPELVRFSDYRGQRFYQEWVQPQGRIDTAYVVLEKSATNAAVLALAPGDATSMVDDRMRQRLALIAPHARRALLIGKSIILKQSEVATFADALNGLSAGMFLVDAEGSIVHSNVAGHDMLYAGDVLRSVGGRLMTCDPQINQPLREVFAAAAAGDTRVGSKGVAFPLMAPDGERYIAHVLPLTSGARQAVDISQTAVAAVFARKATLESPLDVVAQTYKLTPAELRVLLAIVDVGGVPETAEALGVAETTVKTHLYRLFDKAGVSRQADLVKLVAGFSNPLIKK